MSTTDDEFEGLLRAARRAESPSAADRAAVRTALAGALAASVMGPGIAGAAKASVLLGKGSALANVLWPLVAGATLGAGVTATAFVVSGGSSTESERATPVVVAQGAPRSNASLPKAAPAPSAPSATFETAEPTLEPKSPRPSVSVSKSEPTTATVDPLEIETLGIAEVQRALRDGQAARALSLLDAEDRAHPRGVLVEERAAARVFALCSLGRTSAAQSAAAEFARRFPRSLLGDRVRSSCNAP